MSDEKSYSVGRGTPPAEFQFQPGQSGNRRGRPKGTRNVKTVVQEFARKTHGLPTSNKKRRVSTIELLIEILKRMAISGDIEADKIIEHLRDRAAPAAKECGYLVVPEVLEPEEFMRQAEIENRLRPKPPSYDERLKSIDDKNR